MKNLTEAVVDRVTFKYGHLHVTTASCGCCADYFTTDPEAYSKDWTMTHEELVKYVERLEDQVDALRGYLEANSDKDEVVHVDTD